LGGKGLNKLALLKHNAFQGETRRLQRLGLVIHISPSLNVVVKVEKTPKIGETVVDENLKPVGKVFDILGPVSSPYALIKPAVHELEKLVNRRLYVSPQRGERRK
jgi:RNA-binding protein